MLNSATTILCNLQIYNEDNVTIKNEVLLKMPEIQIIISLLIYDLRGGCTKYRSAILAYDDNNKII
jgi:hypothetical protein